MIRKGRALIEPYTQHVDPSIEPYRDDFPLRPEVFTTPRGRDMFAHHGFVPREYAPTAELEEWNVEHLVDVMEHCFTKTRWERMFLVPRSQQALDGGVR